MATTPESAKSKPSSASVTSEKPPPDRLDSWKEIAAYLGRDVTTVQRWEKREGMPVHRHQHDRMGSVYASRAELDAWQNRRSLQPQQEEGSPLPPPASPSTSRTWWKPVLLLLAAGAVTVIVAGFWLRRIEYFWQSPIAHARFQTLTDFDGSVQAVAMSRDAHFVAFLSDRDGQTDVWVTQVGSAEFHNLTHGSVKDLVNPSIRALGFSPDASLVTFWIRRRDAQQGDDISIWAVPTLGGQPKPYLEGVAEFDWSRDGGRLAYHTPGPGDPLFVSDTGVANERRPIFAAPAGLHAHFPLWSPDAEFIYFTQGALPDNLDIWRIAATGGAPERITSQNARVTYPVLLDRRTLMYLAGDEEGAGPWLYSIDVERRVAHRLTSGPDRYTSLAAGADGRHLVATLANPKRTLWHLRIAGLPGEASVPTPIPLTTSAGSFPRMGADYLLYVSENGTGESLWKLANGSTSELWTGKDWRVIGAPAISPDGREIALSVREGGQTLLYLMHSDGTNVQIVTHSLDLQGTPAWAPDGRSIDSAAVDHGYPHIVRIPLDGRPPKSLVQEYSVDPAWAPDGRFLVYSSQDIGTRFLVKAITAGAAPRPLQNLNLTRGARHLAFLPGGHSLLVLRGDLQHKDLWLVDVDTGAERQLTHLPSEFDVQDFDISSNGHDLVLERMQDRSDVVLLDLPQK
jgi:Tol biopolymer transport system component